MDLPPLKISYPPLDPDYIARSVFAFRLDKNENDDELPMHIHRKGQLVLALAGSVMCRVSDGLIFGPANGAVWVPGGIAHSNAYSGNGSYYAVFIEPDVAPLPQKCCTLMVTPLIREIIRHLAEFPPGSPEDGPTSRLNQVLLDELLQTPREQMYLPISTDSRLQHIVESILRNPSNQHTMADWSRHLAMSERSLSRLVLRETGMTFGKWRQSLHIIIALQRLSAGLPVQSISESLGYESVSAFITMFKKAMGKPPGRYLIERTKVSL